MDLSTGDRAAPGLAPSPPDDQLRPPREGGPELPAAAARRPLLRNRAARVAEWALAALVLAAFAALVLHFDHTPKRQALKPMPDVLRTLGATALTFGIAGFGVVRLVLPAALRDYELLWVLPTGGCVLGLALTVLGFAAVPYPAALLITLAAGLALGVYAVRRRGWPTMPAARMAWPALLAVLVMGVTLVPMVTELRYVAPTGTGSDAHVATGVAQFLKHSYPTSVNLSQPINQMQPTWQSKYPIYYAFAAVSSVSGLATWQVLPALAAAMLGLAAFGLFLVARQVLRAPVAVSLAAMALAALNREVLHTIMNPYFNQTWGFFAMPFTLVAAWWLVQPGISRTARQGLGLLLVLFGLVLILAYPLAAPIPIVPIAVFLWDARRRRIKAGEHVVRVRDFYRGPRSLLWMVPVAVLLAIPVAGAIAKAVSAAEVLLPGRSLVNWAGDLTHYIPFDRFLSIPNSSASLILVVVVLLLAAYGLARQPPALRWGLGGLLAIGLLVSLYLRHRQYGYYFEFKLLAFIGPLILLIATVGAGRLATEGVGLVRARGLSRALGPALIAVLAVSSAGSAFAEVKATGFQLGRPTIQLSSWARSLPKDASIRLDMPPPLQLWAAYFLSARPLCSELPLLGTQYPHVPVSRKADYIVAWNGWPHSGDTVGPPLRINPGYSLYRQKPSVPGVSYCSRRQEDKVYKGAGHSAR